MRSYKPPKSPSYKAPKAPSYKAPKIVQVKAPKAPAAPKSTAPKFKMPKASLTKIMQQRQTSMHNKGTAQANKKNYNQQYNATGLRRVLNWFKLK